MMLRVERRSDGRHFDWTGSALEFFWREEFGVFELWGEHGRGGKLMICGREQLQPQNTGVVSRVVVCTEYFHNLINKVTNLLRIKL